jgi:hypothetical protein
LAQAVKVVVKGTVASNLWSARAVATMENIRREFDHVRADGNTLAVFHGGRRTEWFTFAGGRTNDLLAAHLARTNSLSALPNALSLSFPDGVRLEDLRTAVSSMTAVTVSREAAFDDEAVEALKFHQCLPPSLRQQVLRKRFVLESVLAQTLTAPTHVVIVGEGG